ncbi:hypothetical protein BJV78DRAFT_631968 [Lactifluus subvellereus]|nr:hypothetical protein BJV78DRAFT_631968 [Lactifluus subvellereus]
MAEGRQIASETGVVRPPSEFEAHEVRITQGGKIHAWVQFALKFFEENDEKALVLHTLPAAAKGNQKTETAAGDDDEPRNAPQSQQDTHLVKESDRKGLSPSTITIPRLISVVEIIKREYLAAMDATKSPSIVGLYQYNEMGCLEDGTEEKSAGEGMTMTITEALAGTRNVMTKRSPYMKVTLCRKELAGIQDRGATPQGPLKRKLSKSAKGRLKKRMRKERQGESENGNRG